MLKSQLCALTALFCIAEAASVKMINDSPFPLAATVLSATGEVMGRQTLQPQEQVNWQNSSLNADQSSQSPFTVIFYCNDGNIYGIVNGVETGGMVQATTSSGAKFCHPKKEDKKAQKDSPLQYQDHSINPDQWRKQDRY